MVKFNKKQVGSILKNAFDVADKKGNLSNNCVSANKTALGVVEIVMKEGFNPSLKEEFLCSIFPREQYDLSFSDHIIKIKKNNL